MIEQGIPAGRNGGFAVLEDGTTADRTLPPRRWPALRILAAVRMAFDLRKLVLAVAGLLLLHLGWSMLDRAFPESSALTPDVWPPAMVGQVMIVPGGLAGILTRLAQPVRVLVMPLFALLDPTGRWPAMGHALLAIAWLFVVWGFFGGAIARIAAIQEARLRQAGIGEAIRFARRAGPSMIVTPSLPLMGIALFSLSGLVLGLLYRVPAGDAVAGVLLFVPLLAGLVMALLIASLVAGWPMFHAAMATGADSSLDALSRAYSYLNQRLILFAVGVAIAGAAGLVGLALVDWLAWGVIRLAVWSLTLAGPTGRIVELFVPNPSGPNTFAAAPHRFWLGAVRLFAHAWIYSYFWTAATQVYLWLRHEVDGTPSAIIDPPGTPGA